MANQEAREISAQKMDVELKNIEAQDYHFDDWNLSDDESASKVAVKKQKAQSESTGGK